MIEQPEGIIVTISNSMLKKGYRHWLKNFLNAMEQDDMTYWVKVGNKPKHDILYVYLLIGGKIRFRTNFVMAEGAMEKEFDNGDTMFSKAWIIITGKVTRPTTPIPMKGFQGFRYTQKLF